MKVEFKFEPKQPVYTPFARGYVSSCNWDDEGVIRYYVKNEQGGQWFREDELRFAEDRWEDKETEDGPA